MFLALGGWTIFLHKGAVIIYGRGWGGANLKIVFNEESLCAYGSDF